MHIFGHRRYIYAILTNTPIEKDADIIIGRPLLFDGTPPTRTMFQPNVYDPEERKNLSAEELQDLKQQARLFFPGSGKDATNAAEYLPTRILYVPGNSPFRHTIRRIESRSTMILGEGVIASTEQESCSAGEFILFANEQYLRAFFHRIRDMIEEDAQSIAKIGEKFLPVVNPPPDSPGDRLLDLDRDALAGADDVVADDDEAVAFPRAGVGPARAGHQDVLAGLGLGLGLRGRIGARHALRVRAQGGRRHVPLLTIASEARVAGPLDALIRLFKDSPVLLLVRILPRGKVGDAVSQVESDESHRHRHHVEDLDFLIVLVHDQPPHPGLFATTSFHRVSAAGAPSFRSGRKRRAVLRSFSDRTGR